MIISVLYQDEHLIVCVKPVGVLSERGGLPELLEEQCGGEVYCVHRLDRSVGGLMVCARDRDTAGRLSAMNADKGMEKEYLAVVEGCPEQKSGELRDYLFHDARKNKSFVVRNPRKGVKEAILSYRCLETQQTEQGTLSLLRIRLQTGRSHQIRVQFASRGLPLLGDRRYGSRTEAEGPALWSAGLRFPDPQSGAERKFESLPPDSYPWTAFQLQR